MKSIELFAGAGGLGLGVALAGFESLAVVEWDKWACATLRENQQRGFPLVSSWPLWQGDVREFDWSSIPTDIDLVAGGPPCQPFSMAGKHQAYDDRRDMFPATVEIIRKLQPKAFMLENVKGLTRASFANYFQYVLLQLEFPEIIRRGHEAWHEHLQRLQVEKSSGRQHGHGLTYNVIATLANAADYGVAQRRERVFIVGFRTDLAVEWAFPAPTHSLDGLLHSQWIGAEYWDRHAVKPAAAQFLAQQHRTRIDKLRSGYLPFNQLPWRTVRDALADIPDPRASDAGRYWNHVFQPGARAYPGHTGSPLDLPAKTLKAGDHGVPGGENMMVLDNAELRYFSARESARLQTFPDGYVFNGAWSEVMRQLGNAVPVALARRVAASIAICLAERLLARAAVQDVRQRA